LRPPMSRGSDCVVLCLNGRRAKAVDEWTKVPILGEQVLRLLGLRCRFFGEFLADVFHIHVTNRLHQVLESRLRQRTGL
jgi:hypothetical protein